MTLLPTILRTIKRTERTEADNDTTMMTTIECATTVTVVAAASYDGCDATGCCSATLHG